MMTLRNAVYAYQIPLPAARDVQYHCLSWQRSEAIRQRISWWPCSMYAMWGVETPDAVKESILSASSEVELGADLLIIMLINK